MSAKTGTYEDTEMLQQDLNKIYKWEDKNLMEFNKNKFEQMSHGVMGCVRDGVYRTK